ncbi:MAG TPA: BatA domain-containing protein [Vicinamibacterales bacterium]|nr:BatA domain-containing protein [Vicinamibacterales bacterium]
MSFLTPLFLLGLAALAVPVLVHLIQRERKTPVEFPSLMFLRRVPYQSVQRRRINNWPLFLLRSAAVLLTVLAFSRPFFSQTPVQASIANAGAREVVVLLDRSASMGYGDHWQRAKDEAKKVIDGLGNGDQATLVLFDRSAEENVRATGDKTRLRAAVDAAELSAAGSRYAPALRLAQSLLSRSTLGRKEAVVVSDMQRTGWDRPEQIQFPEGTTFTPVSVAATDTANVSVTSVTFNRTRFANEERIIVTAAIANRGPKPVENVPVVLEIDGLEVATSRTTLTPGVTNAVVFPAFTLAQSFVRGRVKAGTDSLAADNVFQFVLSPARPTPVIIAVRDGAEAAESLYLAAALDVGSPKQFDVQVVPMSKLTAPAISRASVLIVSDATMPGALGPALKGFVERGGGILTIVGSRGGPLDGEGALLPGTLAEPKDAAGGRAETLGVIDFSHVVFELFKTPKSGDFSGVRFFRYRPISPAAGDLVLARFADGSVAMSERRVGAGKVIAFGSTLDSNWNDLVLKPVFVPMLHQVARYLGQVEVQPAWQNAGQVVDVSQRVAALTSGGTDDRVTSALVVSPGGSRQTVGGQSGMSVELREQGFYEVRPQGAASSGRPFTLAVNIDPGESDLASMDAQEFTAGATGKASLVGTSVPTDIKPAESERRQSIWWFLLLVGFVLLVAESIIANRLSQKPAFGIR